MKIILTTVLFLSLSVLPTADISMLGIKIGDSRKSLENIKLKIDAKEGEMIKFKTDNGNDFSITCQKGKVVYMENDWIQDNKGTQPLFSDFIFGQTSLREIRKKFETNGFTYKQRGTFTTDKYLITFNCFEFDSPNNEIFVTITKVSLTANVTEDNVADNLKLDAIIIANKSYLDKEWGKEKVYDKNYRKIKP
jgi:hypothetical protein